MEKFQDWVEHIYIYKSVGKHASCANRHNFSSELNCFDWRILWYFWNWICVPKWICDKIEYVPIRNDYFQKENTHTKKEQNRCQLKNVRAIKKQNKSTLKIFPLWYGYG